MVTKRCKEDNISTVPGLEAAQPMPAVWAELRTEPGPALPSEGE